MYTLYHYPLCPFSRKVRILLTEKDQDFELVEEIFWQRRKEFWHLNPAMQVPVLVLTSGRKVPDSYAICEYIDEKFPSTRFMGKTPEERANIRRLISWFDNKFYNEVTRYLLKEKIIRHYTKKGETSSEAIRAAKLNIIPHLEYITYLTNDNKWFEGDKLSLADITASAHLSVVDYLGEIPWDSYPKAKEWYALIKSRPSFRKLLSDKIPGFIPPKHYANLDF